MSTVSTTTEVRTLADLIDRLGGVPLDRIRMRPAPGTATKADLEALDARGEKLLELVDGAIVEKAVGFREGMLAIALASLIHKFVKQHKLGVVAGADATMEVLPELVRLPDVSFVSWQRLPHGIPREAIPDLAPDLAVEVLSRTNTRAEMRRKRRDYFQGGVRQVWMVDPEARTIQIFTSEEAFVELTSADTLDGGEVLPGFQLPVAELFAELDERP
jgi:Uma2 family endonuclease